MQNLRPIKLSTNKNTLTAEFSLTCLEIRLRNEEAINSTRNMLYPLKVFTSCFIDVDTFYLFLNWFSTHVSDDQKYRQAKRMYKYTKIQGPQFQRNYIKCCQISKKWLTWHVISIIAENKLHAHHKTHLHTMKVYNPRPLQFC